ncbi:U6 snRNA-associated Sm-like protein LSm11 [Haematobia irritans]|uniref:U6 snRNA-associated Sm-like protein LSm11 n=1 Tax=Haematobia irritans TaxID=7368 RepID=UPI003F50A1D2
MAAFESALKKVGICDVAKKPKTNNQPKPGSSKEMKTILVEEDKTKRRFQEHQMAIKTQVKIKNKHTRNLLGQMADANSILKPLNDYIATRQRIRVMVRKEKGIKGYIEGTLEMFDRHWNLLLVDALECYIQRKHKYTEDNLVLPIENHDCSQRLRQLGIKLPKQEVKSLNRKTVEIKRYLPQIFLRGEHVVLIHPTGIVENITNPS